MECVTLHTLATRPYWVAWQEEDRPDGKKTTKVPYNPKRPGTIKALADKPKTWGTRAQATAKAAELPKRYQMGGVGIEFTSLDDGRRTGGIDLDTCRDPATGIIEPWARSVIDRFSTYTEISPSQTGAKLFFLYAAADETELREALGRTVKGDLKYSTLWARKTGGDHPSAIELHLGNRYFTITDDILPGSADELREVATADLLHLIQVEGPAFVGKAEPKSRLPTAGKSQSGGNDQSRSAAAFRVAAASRRRGVTYEAMCDELRTHELTAEWFTDKGQANGGRELQRLWEKTDLATGDLILSPSSPLPSARTYVAREHSDDGQRTLHHQNATFYEWRRSHYVERSGEEMRGRLYGFLEKAKRHDDDGFLGRVDGFNQHQSARKTDDG
jgi:putative DNA primase/helicase